MRALAQATESDRGASPDVVASSFSVSIVNDGWRVIGLCGRGGTAEVWHAVASDGREFALKCLRPELRQSARAGACLLREFEWLCRVDSPHLIRAFGIVEHEGSPALVLEHLPNGDLVSLAGSAPRHWLAALRGTLQGLRALHRNGIAHGDVKARNVLFTRDDDARLIDLTSARAADLWAVPATPAYGLPRGVQASAREADCFALAVLVYELATGTLPYGPDGPLQIGALRPATRPADPVAAKLLTAASELLEAAGRLPEGLSHLTDVIESVGAERA